MDAVSYLTNLSRLCDYYTSREMCGNSCPVIVHCNSGNGITVEEAKESVAAVEKWSKEHPPVTNRKKFEEVFGCDMEWVITNCNGEIPTVTIQGEDMDVLISKKDTLKCLCEKCWEGDESTGCSEWKCIEYRIIEDMPSADRLIKEAVSTLIHTKGDDAVSGAFRNAGRFVQNAIDGEPPEFEKIQTGEWRLNSNGYWRCSKCGAIGDKSDNFCRYCGRRMKVEHE